MDRGCAKESKRRAPKEGIMDFHGDAAREAQDMARAGQQSHEADVQVLVQRLGISRELAEHIVSLENRIKALEPRDR